MQKDLFPSSRRGPGKPPPLAHRMRPRTLEEFLGQEELLGPKKPLRRMIEEDRVSSMIFWGPPGCGKTTLAGIIAGRTGLEFRPLSAVTSGVKDVRRVIEEARGIRQGGGGTILFVDEIHRFHKAQQDAFLPHVEEGTVVLIGATTENPSFEVIAPLLSRCPVFVMRPLDEGELRTLIHRALADEERGLGGRRLSIDDEAAAALVRLADSDARRAMNLLEGAAHLAADAGTIAPTQVEEAAQGRVPRYDKSGEEHFNIISALHKSLRGGDVDASLYWLARMLVAGEEPLYVARRMVRFASEDVGLADPQALVQAMAATEAFRFLGPPEGELALAQLAIYLATAPKSNRAYTAWGAARREAEEKGSQPVPMEIRNAPTRLMKDVGYGKGYDYPHDDPDAVVDQRYLPERVRGGYYEPTDRGFEAEVARRVERWKTLRENRAR